MSRLLDGLGIRENQCDEVGTCCAGLGVSQCRSYAEAKHGVTIFINGGKKMIAAITATRPMTPTTTQVTACGPPVQP